MDTIPLKITDTLETITLLVLIEEGLKMIEEFFLGDIENIVVIFSSPPKMLNRMIERAAVF